LQAEYGLSVEAIAFLPLGADLNTAVYRVTAKDAVYFLKLRRGDFSEASVAVPAYLHSQGIRQVIPPVAARSGRLWADLAPYTGILYPFVEGLNGFQRSLTDRQWVEFGAAMKRFHTAEIPPEITAGVLREEFSPCWRQIVRIFLAQIPEKTYEEPVAAELAAFLNSKWAATYDLVRRAGRYARLLAKQPPEFILCHGDIHAWNLLIPNGEAFYMVDWDTLIFAPRERDLMFIGGGLGGRGHTPQEEEALFYRGYGQTQIHPAAMAYYRYERIIEDLAIYCEQIFLSDEGGEDRKQSLENVKSNYLPGGTIELARRSDGWLNDSKERP
jgi:spectinomycin phosphotransferase